MVGRHEEQRLLKELYASNEAEFVVIYGRRRVGKTYLVRETFNNNFFFSYTGIANCTAKQQKEEFIKALREYGWKASIDSNTPVSWFDIFYFLRDLIKSAQTTERLLIFIDELPWMDNLKSDFVPALEQFWNGWAAAQKNIMLIICGSSASWITKKIFRNKGGLYNRVTRQIALNPFTLAECKEFFDKKGVVMNTQDLIESYMIFGGIPYYLRMFERKYSLALNVDQLCFAEKAPLRNEFNRLMDTLFSNPDKHIRILEALYSKKKGLTREAIAGYIDFGNGGNLTRLLTELEESGFIRKYKPFGKKKNNALYHITDFFTLFHLTYIRNTDSYNFWSTFTDNASHRAWSGYAFEQVCLAHITNIKTALGISGIRTDCSSWISSSAGKTQIDLVIDRGDRVINLCEMKFMNAPFEIDRAYDLNIRNKIETFRKETKTRKALHLVMVTTYGVKPGKYTGIVQSEITMDALI